MPNLIEMNGEEALQDAVHSEFTQDFTLGQAVIEGEFEKLLLDVRWADFLVLGKDQKLLAVKWLEPSVWSTFACLTAERLYGSQKKYFLKVSESRCKSHAPCTF